MRVRVDFGKEARSFSLYNLKAYFISTWVSSESTWLRHVRCLVSRLSHNGQEMANLAASLVGKRNATLGLERMNANVAIALKELGLDIVDAQQAIETVRTFKSPEEVKCIVASLRATEVAVGRLRDAVSPGLAENQLWSVMHKSLIEQNGDYVETRLLTAGPRANTWFQESASYAISKNDLVVLDTDVVGCHGYYSDFSRTLHAGPDPPTEE